MNYHGGTGTQRKLIHGEITEHIIGAIEAHDLRGLKFHRQVPLPVQYKGISLDCGYRIDIVVEDAVVLELKCVEHVMPVHEAQLLTYLKLTEKRVGMIVNFYVPVLAQGGIVRKVP